jgi:hypothetical protein
MVIFAAGVSFRRLVLVDNEAYDGHNNRNTNKNQNNDQP